MTSKNTINILPIYFIKTNKPSVCVCVCVRARTCYQIIYRGEASSVIV